MFSKAVVPLMEASPAGQQYFVFQQDNGKVVGEECERYKSAKVCYHSVAVAGKCGTVEKFISWKKEEVCRQLLLGVS